MHTVNQAGLPVSTRSLMSRVYPRNACESEQDFYHDVAGDAGLHGMQHPVDCESIAAAAEQTVPHEAK